MLPARHNSREQCDKAAVDIVGIVRSNGSPVPVYTAVLLFGVNPWHNRSFLGQKPGSTEADISDL
jgi:hypothetical protein